MYVHMHHHETKRGIMKAYSNYRECSVPEAVYLILPELKRRRILPTMYFVNTNLLEKAV